MQHSILKTILDLFARTLLCSVPFLVTACTLVIDQPVASVSTELLSPTPPMPVVVIMPSAMLAPEKAQPLFTNYCAEYLIGPMDDPDGKVQLAWQKTGKSRFNSCGMLSMRVDSGQLAIPLEGVCAVNDKLYHYIAPAWQVADRNSAALPLPGAMDLAQLDWPIDQLVAQNQPVGREHISGQDVLHYQVKDPTLLSRLGFRPGGFLPKTGQVDVWIAVPAGYVVNYAINLAADGGGIDQRSFTFSPLNQLMPIHPPAQAVAYQQKLNDALARNHAILPTCYTCDIPLPPGGTIEAPGMMTSNSLIINTNQPGEETVAYYEQQLPKEGWRVKREKQGEGQYWLMLTRRDQQLDMNIWFYTKDSPTRVVIGNALSASTDLTTGNPLEMHQYCP